MQSNSNLTHLYQRYINNEISMEELQQFISQTETAELQMAQLLDSSWQSQFHTANETAKIIPFYQKLSFRIASIAAILLLCIGAYLFFNQTNKITPVATKSIFKNDVAAGTNKAILTLADGKTIQLTNAAKGNIANEGTTQISNDVNGKLVYLNKAGKTPEVLYNKLATPRGGQHYLQLSDGTEVWLNAASSISYPVVFTGNERLVSITGEAYFEVAKNADKPFKVKVNNNTVTVLGTHFNIMAYDDELLTKVTLLEGAVQLNSNTILKPNQQGIIKNNYTTVKEVNVQPEVAWKNGLFQFDKIDITTIMRQLSRWYNVNVSYEGNVPQKHFVGEVPRNTKLSTVLKILELSDIHFKVEGNNITVLK